MQELQAYNWETHLMEQKNSFIKDKDRYRTDLKYMLKKGGKIQNELLNMKQR